MGESVIGPVPEDRDPQDYDRQRRRVLWSLPSGLYVIGSHGHLDGAERWNLMTANQVVQVSTDPKMVAVGVDAEAVTCALVRDGGSFAVSFVDREDRALVRRFVKPVAEVTVALDGRLERLGGEPVLQAVSGAPILAAAPAWIDCAVRHVVELGSHVLFVGEVVDVGGRTDETDTRPVLRMEDTRMNYGG
jgi:flavin reductase (DIM6/NTAB) family NADH-FMN oxidoreductase RutF